MRTVAHFRHYIAPKSSFILRRNLVCGQVRMDESCPQWRGELRHGFGLPVSTLTRIVMALTVSGPIRSQHNPFIGWVSVHIRGRRYEQANATFQGCKPAAGTEAGGADFRGIRNGGV